MEPEECLRRRKRNRRTKRKTNEFVFIFFTLEDAQNYLEPKTRCAMNTFSGNIHDQTFCQVRLVAVFD